MIFRATTKAPNATNVNHCTRFQVPKVMLIFGTLPAVHHCVSLIHANYHPIISLYLVPKYWARHRDEHHDGHALKSDNKQIR